MATLTLNDPFDMTDWGFTAIENGAVAKSTASQYYVTNGGTTYQFTGTGLTYDASHHLTGGTITGYHVIDSTGATELSLSSFSLSAATLASAIANGDSNGIFEKTVFNAGDNTITGSAGDDVLTDGASSNTISGGDGNDLILITHQSSDTIFGGAGDDTIDFKGQLLLSTFDGGDGNDTVIIHSAAFAIELGLSGDTGITNVENLILQGTGHFTVLDNEDSAVAAGQTMTIDASALAAGSNLIMIGTATETDGGFDVIGGAGNDSLAGGGGSNTFHLENGGNDHVLGGAGNDVIYMGAALTAADRINGGFGGTGTFGSGSNIVYLNGDYSAGLTLGPQTLANIDDLILEGAHSYKLTLNQGIGHNGGVAVIGSDLTGGHNMIVDGSAVTDTIGFIDSAGNDVLTGGSGGDQLILISGGNDKVNGGGGNDQIIVYNQLFTAADAVDGGTGVDTLTLAGDYSAGVTFTATTLTNVETIDLTQGFDYKFTLNNATVAAGKTMTVDGSTLGVVDQIIVDGSAEKDGKLVFLGGAGDDTFTGGTQKTIFTGGGGADHLISTGKSDTFDYTSASDSTGVRFDTITAFNTKGEHIATPGSVNAIDASVNNGTLSLATFDANLTSAVDAGHLAAGDAVIFKPSAGTLKGDVFLVIDENGTAGYQAGADLVIQLDHAISLGTLSTANFAGLI